MKTLLWSLFGVVGIGLVSASAPAFAENRYSGDSGVQCVRRVARGFVFYRYAGSPVAAPALELRFEGEDATELLARERVFDDCVSQGYIGRTESLDEDRIRRACRAEARRAVCERFRNRYCY